jgi:hypothetical protein
MGVGEQVSEVKVKLLSRLSVRLCLLDSQYDKRSSIVSSLDKPSG